jgi:hypothetical protein
MNDVGDQGAAGTIATVLPLLLVALVVVRFAFRELRERTVRMPSIWIRPALMVALTGYLVVLALSIDGREDTITAASLVIGVVLGAITGLAIVRNTTFAPAGVVNAVKVRGNRATLAIWVGALAVRVLARYLYPGAGNPRAQLPLNCGTVALVAVAFVVIAAVFQREIGRLRPG